MLAPRPPDFPPLLSLGFHPVQIGEVERMCVAAFPLSISRTPIMAGLRQFIQRLVDAHVVGDLWLDGSFFTTKIDPEDVDIVLRMQAPHYDSGTAEVQDAVNWVIANQKLALHCDSYVLFEYPSGDPLHGEGQWWYSYWHAKWGFSREEDPKGIAVVTLSGSGP
jgi:hypothetical protein